MRPLLFAIFLATASAAQCADRLLEGWNRGVVFLEKRVRDDPEDFIAWNQLTDRNNRA